MDLMNQLSPCLLVKRMRTFRSMQEKVPKGSFFVIRVDGRGFHKLAELTEMKRPFDVRFRHVMSDIANAFMNESGLNPIFAYGQSDEISFLFRWNNNIFSRRVEKLCSITAGFVSSQLQYQWNYRIPPGFHVVFDARIIPLETLLDIVVYHDQRQNDAWRNCVSGHAFYTLVGSGYSHTEAERKLNGMDINGRIEMLIEDFSFNISDVPSWQRRGWAIRWTEFQKEGYNPITEKKVMATRRETTIMLELPTFITEKGSDLITEVAQK